MLQLTLTTADDDVNGVLSWNSQLLCIASLSVINFNVLNPNSQFLAFQRDANLATLSEKSSYRTNH